MSEWTEAGEVVKRDDGTLVFMHGHRFPDNVQRVEQEYDAAGRLTTVRVQWSGFAGKILDITASLDERGEVVREDGYRAPEMTTPVSELIKPLPEPAVAASSPPEPDGQVGLRAGLERIYGPVKS